MTLLWGVLPVLVNPADFEAPEALARRLVTELGLAGTGQRILTVAGFDSLPGRDTPTISILTV
jgi:hypothetical protein